jgi:hypothetical protein
LSGQSRRASRALHWLVSDFIFHRMELIIDRVARPLFCLGQLDVENSLPRELAGLYHAVAAGDKLCTIDSDSIKNGDRP